MLRCGVGLIIPTFQRHGSFETSGNYSPNDTPSNCVRPGSTTHTLLTFCRTWEKYTQQYDWQTACKTAKKIRYSSLLLLAGRPASPTSLHMWAATELSHSAMDEASRLLKWRSTPISDYMTAFHASGTNFKQGSGALWHPKPWEYI